MFETSMYGQSFSLTDNYSVCATMLLNFQNANNYLFFQLHIYQQLCHIVIYMMVL